VIPLLLALANCPAVPADTMPLIPAALIWMTQGTAVVARDSASGVAYEYVNVGDSAVAIYRNCQYLGMVQNSLENDAEYPPPDAPAIWRGGGLAVIFVERRFDEQRQKAGELIGVVRE
jgi:hypothetical protein